MKETRIDINGIDYFIRQNNNDGPLVLMIHGWPDDSTMWRHQAEALTKAGYKVVAPDIPGFGLSGKPVNVERYKVERLAEDMFGILDHYGVDKAHVVAHDYGAVTGWTMVYGNPDRLLSYTAGSVGHFGTAADTTLAEMERHWYFFAYQLSCNSQLFRAGNSRLLRYLTETHPDQDKVLNWMLEGDNLEQAWRWDRANSVGDLLVEGISGVYADLPPVTVPTMGIYGEDDYFLSERQMKETGKFMAAQWRYEKIEGGHWSMLHQPSKTNALLLDWLQSCK